MELPDKPPFLVAGKPYEILDYDDEFNDFHIRSEYVSRHAVSTAYLRENNIKIIGDLNE